MQFILKEGLFIPIYTILQVCSHYRFRKITLPTKKKEFQLTCPKIYKKGYHKQEFPLFLKLMGFLFI